MILMEIQYWNGYKYTSKLKLHEAEKAKWLSKDSLNSVQWLPADMILIEKNQNQMKQGSIRRDTHGFIHCY